jgi:hypothetical protein
MGPSSEEWTEQRSDEGSGEADPSGLAKDLLRISARAAEPEPTREGLLVQMPKKPLPGQ